MSANIVHLTDSNFAAEVLQNKEPVLVDFWAEWCGPCRALAPVINEVAEAYLGKLKVAKMNIDEETQMPSQYGIRAIPTLLLFKDGAVVAQSVGMVTKAKLDELISKHL